MTRISEIFDHILSSSLESKEGEEAEDKSFVVGSFIGVEIPIILLVISLFSIFNFGLAAALLGMAVLVLLLVNNLPAGIRLRVESSGDFDSMAFYVMVVLFAVTVLIAWSWSG